MNNFAAFILSHGRPDKVFTYKSLIRQGYTGKIFIVVDNEDSKVDQYIENFNKENVIIFNKEKISKNFDSFDNFKNKKAIVYARNACFDIAEKNKIEYFL